ncbi:cytochrome P450 2K1-like [Dendropsophus ebraccatus]|uniref:cytochrome P450 2K1-like n=1 Tax=Dendropsophus ebraccatus TaxID=150705 RepID=UPI00383169F1
MFAMDPITILLSVIVFLFLIMSFKKWNQDVYKNFPPGPKPLPIIGNILKIDMSKPYRSFVEISKEYGTVFSVKLGPAKVVVLCGLETIKDALVNHVDDFLDRPKARVFSRAINDHGIILANGSNWKVMRRFTLSTLRDYGMGKKSIENKISEEAESLVQKFRSYKGKPFDNLKTVNSAVANIIVAILLSRRFDYEDPTILKLVSLINENIRLFGSPLVRLYATFPLLVYLLPGTYKKIFANIEEFRGFLKATFTKQRKELDVNDQRNLIDAFLVKQQEGTPESTQYYHDDNLIALVDNLFVAGMETTSTTLRWGLLLMMKYPEIQEKVQSEIEKVIGSSPPQIEHRKQLPYTDAVIHEVQRFGDIAPASVAHVASRDVTFRGYFIPKGTTVIPLLHSALKDKAYFKKPEEFYPEHFLDSDGNFNKNEAFIPFSLGKRSCAGETLAKMELFIFFTTLLQNFTFQAPAGAKLDLTPGVGSTNAPKPYEICAIPRR